MVRRLSKAWRTLASGASFVIFGLAGLLIGVVMVPFVHLLAPSRQAAELRVQWLVHQAFRGFLRWMSGLGVSKFHFDGAERLQTPGVLVVANHPTLIDAVVLIAAMPQCYCVVKQENFRNPFMRSAARAAGYLSNEDGVALVADCTRLLQAGKSLLLFPEGTRSPEGRLGVFQRGWAHVALRSGCDPLPVIISCQPPALMKGQKWYEIPDRRFQLTVRVDQSLSTQAVTNEPRGRAVRALNATLREHFEKGLARADV